MARVINPGDEDDQAAGGVTEEDIQAEERALEQFRKVPKATTRHRAAAKLRVRGASFTDIADTLGYTNPTAARTAVEIALANMNPEEDLTSQRQLALARLESLLQSLSGKALSSKLKVEIDGIEKMVANDEHIPYAKMFLAVVDRIIKLQGIDAPTQIELHTPETAEFEAVIRSLTKITNAGATQEGDIFVENEDGVFESSDDEEEKTDG